MEQSTSRAENSDNQKDSLNILFIFSDQMHPFAMGCMDNPEIHAPNLDRLAAEGTLFTNAYSNWPLCTPFRANLITGRYGSQTGVMGNNQMITDDERTLAAALNDGGYRTSYVGKWHLGATGNIGIPPELRAGFTDFIGYQCYNHFLDNVWFFDEEDNKTVFDKHRTDATTDVAIERLERIADEPFALFVSYQTPHYPEQPSPEYEAMYDGVTLTKRPNSSDIEPYTATLSPPSPKPWENDPVYQKYGGNLEEYLRLYYAMVTQLDANIGRLLDALDRLSLSDKTAVVFTSDHGDMQGSHGLANKSHPHEESSRIPLIARVPGGAEGRVTDALVSGIDFFPTCLDYAALPLEQRVEGVSFAPLTRGEDQTLNGPIFSETRKWCLIRQNRFKFVASRPELEPTHLYDLEADPYEMTNLVEKDEHREDCERLLATLREWRERVIAPKEIE
ncbi:sulfatase-like hydrolase/transferase [Candidatus Hydrogenedentota bacterium]